MSTRKKLSNKHIQWIALFGGIIAAVVIVGVVKAAGRARSKIIDHSKDPAKDVKPVQGATSSFPLKNGSRNDLVKQLQGYLGVTADGIFGPKTQAALLLKAGKSQIASQADFDQTIKKLAAAAQVSTNSARADKLVSDWKNNSALRLVATTPVDAIGVNEDAYGALTANGKTTGMNPGYNYNRSDYVVMASTVGGYVIFKITNGALAGLYKVDPTKISLA